MAFLVVKICRSFVTVRVVHPEDFERRWYGDRTDGKPVRVEKEGVDGRRGDAMGVEKDDDKSTSS